MSERAIADMIEAIRKPKEKSQLDNDFMLAQIESASPLSIRVSNSVITKNLYINPAYMTEASGGIQRLNELFNNAPYPTALFEFLKEFHKKYIISQGDTVVVVQFGSSFYIVEKVVKVS